MGASSQTEFYDDPTGCEFDADMVCRARDQEMRYLVGSLKVWSRTVALTDIDGWRQTDPRSHGRHQQGLKRLSRTPIEGGGGGGGDKVPVGNQPPRTRQLCFQAQRHLWRTACCAPLLRVQVPRPTRLRGMLMWSWCSWIHVGHIRALRWHGRSTRNCQRNILTTARNELENCLVISLACTRQAGSLS